MLTPADGGNPEIEYATIRMDHINGTHVYGQIAKPKRKGKFPALVIFQWASPPYPLQKSWVTGHAADGWLTLNIEPHDVLPDQPKAYYDALPQAIKNYQSIGNDDREKSYFLEMYLRDYRAVDYITSRDDWDGKTLVVMGTSMGGQQSLCVAGLHPKITHVIVEEPSGCDTNGPLHGRQSGYPSFLQTTQRSWKPRSTSTQSISRLGSPRFSGCDGLCRYRSAPRRHLDRVQPDQGPKEAVPMIESPHNNSATAAQQLPFTSRSTEWLNTLVKGGEVKP